MTSPRDHVLERIFLLQQQAWSAIDDGWPGTLSGKRVAEDEKQLRSYIDDLGRFSDDIELCLSRTLSLSERRDYLYSLLFIFMSAAHFIGSRARTSFSQRNYFASQQGSAGGRRSAAKRADAPGKWQRHTLELARQVRILNPKLSQDRVATRILEKWLDPKVVPPKHRTVRQYISSLEKSGQLPRRL
jgi:hypothetical protein